MNGQPVLFGVLPFRTSEAAYSFPCPACGRTLAHQPDTACPECATKSASAAPKKTTTRRRARKAVS